METLTSMAQSGSMNVLTVCLTVVVLVILFLLRGRLTGVSVSRAGIQFMTGDTDLILNLHQVLDPLDHDCKVRVAENTDGLELREVTPNCTTNTILINQLACETLKMAAFTNHHARELCVNHLAYCEKRLIKINSKLLRHTVQLENDIPTGKDVALFLQHWLLRIVLPPVMDTCRRKISYYESLLKRKNISDVLKFNIQEWKFKNETYLATLSDLKAELQSGKEVLFGLNVSLGYTGVFESPVLTNVSEEARERIKSQARSGEQKKVKIPVPEDDTQPYTQ